MSNASMATQIRAEYATDAQGLITDLGKFEREPIYAPYFYANGLEGFGDPIYDTDGMDEVPEDCESTMEGEAFTVDAEDIAVFPELERDGYKAGDEIVLTYSDQGFVGIGHRV